MSCLVGRDDCTTCCVGTVAAVGAQKPLDLTQYAVGRPDNILVDLDDAAIP